MVSSDALSAITAGQREANGVCLKFLDERVGKVTAEDSFVDFSEYGQNQVTMTQVPTLSHL